MPTVGIMRNFWSNLSDCYNISSKFTKLIEVNVCDVNWCDVLIMIRPNNILSWKFAEKARASGRFVITMCDDNLLELPKSHPDLSWHRKGLIKALNHSDALMSCSIYILNKMIDYTAGKRKIFVDTVVKSEELLIRNYNEENSDTIKFVYAAGGGQHEDLFELLVLPSLIKVAKKCSKKLSITFVSVHPQCGNLEQFMDVSYVKGMPLLEYRAYMEKQKFDIGLSPLENNDFTKCKYFNKYLEYTLSGIVGIYSNVEPYTFVVRDGINGFLADNTMACWEAKLLEAVEKLEIRRNCAMNAQNHVKENFDEKKIMSRIFFDVPEMQACCIKKKICVSFVQWRLIYQFFRVWEYLYKTFFYIKKEGLISAKRKALAKLKIKISK